MTTAINPTLLACISTLHSSADRLSSLIRLNSDQLLHGRVVAVRGSQIVISLLGEQLTAESSLPLTVGQTVALTVREVRPGRIVLQMAQEPGAEQSICRPITDQDLGDQLTAQHLPADPTNLLIARALLRNSLPVANATVSAARHALSFLQTPTADDVNAAIQLLARKLPVTRESLDLAKSALLQTNHLGDRVRTLVTQLITLVNQAEQIEAGGTVAMPPRQILELSRQFLRESPLLIPDHSHNPTFAAFIRQALDQIATPTEHRIAQLLDENARAQTAQGSQLSAAPTKETIIIEPPRLPSNERQVLAPPGKTTHEAPDGSTQHYPAEAIRDFRQQLATLNDALTRTSAELPARHPLSSLLQELPVSIREILSMVEAEQLSNAGQPLPTQPQGFYAVNLPIRAFDQDAIDTAELRIYYQQRDRTKHIDPDNAHLAFLLEMSHLGSVEVHVDLYQKHLRCRIECVNREAIDLFQQSSSELQEHLQDVGYTVDSVHTVLTAGSHVESECTSIPSLSTIDIRA